MRHLSGRSGPESKIFQIGFNRCGTTSIHRFLQANGFRSVHHDSGRLALIMDANLRHGRHILSGYEGYDAYSDMEILLPDLHIEAYRYYEQILQQVPGARFILNTRDVDRWVASRLRLEMDRDSRIDRAMKELDWPSDVPRLRGGRWHRRASYKESYRTAHGLDSIEEVVLCWKAEWQAHVDRVQRKIPADRLLVFDIESDPPQYLCRFVGLEDSAAVHYSNENATLGTAGRFLAHWAPDIVLKLTPRSVKRFARRILTTA